MFLSKFPLDFITNRILKKYMNNILLFLKQKKTNHNYNIYLKLNLLYLFIFYFFHIIINS